MIRRWSAEEDALLSYARVVEIAKVLPSRTYEAIKRRRRLLGFASPLFPRWKKSEDKLIIKYTHEPLAKLTKLIKNRTYDAIKARRSELGYISEKRCRAWLGSEIQQLKLMYPTASRGELLAAFKRHTWFSIAKTASRFGVQRNIPRTMHGDLRNQIRQRAKEDGIALSKLCAQTEVSLNFLRKQPEREDYNRIARIVEFFGGRLTIDWQDV